VIESRSVDVGLDGHRAVELVGERLDAVDATSQQCDAEAVGNQRASGCSADAGRRARDNRDAACV